jgi:3-hydroxy-3-methylglutaryl CoA synthase/NAD(P)-dependent dehydrogenase (short-subunit alcohol dehydrogenase family)/putative sterol carrier protein
MIGICAHGGYIPRYRLDRMSIFQSMGWLQPAIVALAQGEKAIRNWDEDSLTMAVAASRDCLTGVDRKTVDGLYLCSTTLPFGDRLNAGIVKTALQLDDGIQALDLTATMRAGTSGIINAFTAVKAGERRRVLVTATDARDTKPVSFYEMWYGDGAASVLIGDTDVIAEFKGSYSVTHDFVDHYRGAENKFSYTWEERWVRDEGYGKIIPEVVNGLFKKLSLTMEDVDTLVFPCLFKGDHKKIAKKLGATPEKVIDNHHEVCGETGTAHPLVMLSSALEKAKPGDKILLVGFGQGADALYFEVTPQIEKLTPRQGIGGSLENKKILDNYTKYLTFREHLVPDFGIRKEGPSQTALTVLWRRRDMLLGLVGGKCRECGTPQFPSQRTCVNPDCTAVDSQDPYCFQDEEAVVMTFTGDYLAVSYDPPAIYGVVEFKNGGRFIADYTDCELDDVVIGRAVKMTFRKRYHDKERGFHGYFWKAISQPPSEEELKLESMIRFDDRTAVITGAGGGLGKAYALAFAERGANVVVNDVSADNAQAVVQEIEAMGGQAISCTDSVATVEGGQAIVAKAIEAFGKVDILVNNAGILRDKSFVKMEAEDFDQVLDVHLKGAYNVTRPAFQNMRENGYGRIVMTASAAGMFGNFGQANYSSAKMGLIGMMNTLELEGAKSNIKVNTIAPVAATQMTKGLMPDDLFAKIKPECVAPMVLYLCSEQCPVSGNIYNAGMGYFGRTAIMAGPGIGIGEAGEIPPLEEVYKKIEAIGSLEGAKEFKDTNLSVGPMLEVFAPKAEDAGGEDEGLTPAKVFEQMPDVFQAGEAEGVDVVMQFLLSGPKGGEWHVVVAGGACEVVEGAHANPTVTLKMSDDDFPGLMTGKLNGMQAFTTGKLKIEGDMVKSQLVEKLFKF